MDQKKIGSFIADRRKANGLTQSQLAETLGITDKAVSKWKFQNTGFIPRKCLKYISLS